MAASGWPVDMLGVEDEDVGNPCSVTEGNVDEVVAHAALGKAADVFGPAGVELQEHR